MLYILLASRWLRYDNVEESNALRKTTCSDRGIPGAVLPHERHDILNVRRLREHVKGADARHDVSLCAQHRNVPRLCNQGQQHMQLSVLTLPHQQLSPTETMT